MGHSHIQFRQFQIRLQQRLEFKSIERVSLPEHISFDRSEIVADFFEKEGS